MRVFFEISSQSSQAGQYRIGAPGSGKSCGSDTQLKPLCQWDCSVSVAAPAVAPPPPPPPPPPTTTTETEETTATDAPAPLGTAAPPITTGAATVAPPPSPPSGTWSAWFNVGACSATCGGGGTVAQNRTCSGGQCQGASTRTTSCSAANECPSEWDICKKDNCSKLLIYICVQLSSSPASPREPSCPPSPLGPLRLQHHLPMLSSTAGASAKKPAETRMRYS